MYMYMIVRILVTYMVFPGEVTVRSRLLMRAGPVFPFTPGGSNQDSVTLNINIVIKGSLRNRVLLT